MGKITQVARDKYSEHVEGYKKKIDEILKKEVTFSNDLRKGNIKEGVEYHKFDIANWILNLSSYYILFNTLSTTFLGVKNENYLNEARKAVYRSLIYLEEIVTNFIDIAFSELIEHQNKIIEISDNKRFEIVEKLGFTIDMLEEAFGVNSKWKWSFVELEGRFATIAKNLINFKTLVTGLDPSAEYYEMRMQHLNRVKEMLNSAALRYREKYELNTFRIDDFKLAINYLLSLRRLYIYLGENDNADIVKKSIEIWKIKMEKDALKARKK